MAEPVGRTIDGRPMRSKIWNHNMPFLGESALRDIDAAALRAWTTQLLTRVEAPTAQVIWIHLSTILEAAVDDARLLKNPCKAHRTVKSRKPSKKRRAKAWSRSTVAAVRAGLQERYHIAVDLGVGLGLRQGEAFGLGEADFGFDAAVVHIRRQLRRDSKGAVPAR
ncbi:hypothetical protein YWIDRAFT_03139 [Streptomyces sp. SceaMP-e96]|uniref:hypothetical protein n=1 Tax=Streptomyces TaxID=1883 RepID=UPI000823B92F|nr:MULTISPECIES: hypothetical protein [unclassified Streptomyces]MYT13788.1 hypothetical protein [Streptomyces sp. SID4951]SCK55637.1 hypothetical protein YWIDRAFT_03139 [Streptomyces sp. SceaMP-e96]